MDHASTLLLDLALVLGMAGLTTVLCQKLRQSAVLGYLIAGLIVGPYVPIPLFADSERVTALSELGVVLVMFGIGLEFSVRSMLRVLPRSGLVGAIQIGTLMGLGWSAARLLGWSNIEAVVTGAALCVSSSMIVSKALTDSRAGKSLRELVLSVLVIQDFAAVILIAVLTTLVSSSGGDEAVPVSTILATMGKLVGFLVGMVVLGFLVVPRAVRSVARLGSPETLLIASIGLCFAMAQLAAAAGFSVALGAFLAGSLVAESGREALVKQLVRPVRDVFAAIFFVTVGMAVDPASLTVQPVAVAVLVVVIVVGQVASVTVAGFLAGHRIPTAVQAGTALAQIGEFSFIIVGVGLSAGVLGEALLPSIVAASAITAFLTPWMIRWGSPLAAWVDRSLPHALQTYATLYASWLEKLLTSDDRHSLGAQVRRALLWLTLDGLCLAGLVIGAAFVQARAVGWLAGIVEVPPAAATALVLVALVLLASPFVLGVLRLSRQLGRTLARSALPVPEDGAVDFGAAPRRAYTVTVQLGSVLFVALPLAALVQPFVPAAAAVSLGLALLAVVVWLAVDFWRGALDLDEHARAGAEVVAEALMHQAVEFRQRRTVRPLQAVGAAGASPARKEVDLDQVLAMLPGLGDLATIELEQGAPAVGVSLRDLDLRGLTGASVIAIRRGDDRVPEPLADARLEVGDVVCLAGSSVALDAARDVIGGGSGHGG